MAARTAADRARRGGQNSAEPAPRTVAVAAEQPIDRLSFFPGAGHRRRTDSCEPLADWFLQLHPLQLAIQRLPLDPEDLRGFALVAACGRKHLADLVLFGVGQRLD